jgi:hypothetical protein
MQIELDDTQADVLRTLLDSTLRELSYEIASADVPSFRLMLRGQREAIRSIRIAVGEPMSAAEGVSQ